MAKAKSSSRSGAGSRSGSGSGSGLDANSDADIRTKTKAKRSGGKGPRLRQPLVGIIMGSDSDLPVMTAAAEVLNEFSVPYEVRVVSAHRTPTYMLEYAASAEARGLKAIIAGAGGAAHLPGMVASATALPVIGVPVHVGKLGGVDALLSIVQMPKGVPVATMAIDNSANAALFAIRMLAVADEALLARLKDFMEKQEKKVRKADETLQKKGRR